jgi:hypothetical protein
LDTRDEQIRFTNNLERIDNKYLSEFILVGGTKRRKGDKENIRSRKKRHRYEDEEDDEEKRKKKKKKNKNKDKDGNKDDGESDDEDNDDDYDDDEDRWVWTESGKKIRYSLDWGPGQPNNGNNQRCLALRKEQGRFRFHDIACDDNKGIYVCQK